MNARLLVRNFLRGNACPRPPLAPTAFYHAARIDGGTFEDLFADPTRLTRALLDQRRLLETDVVTVRFDAVMLAAAAGAEVDWQAPVPSFDPQSYDIDAALADPERLVTALSALFDVVGRLTAELRREAPVMAALAGPRALAGGSEAGRSAAAGVLRHIVDHACKAGAEVVLIEETPHDWDEAAVRSQITPLANTARYYTASMLVTAPHPPAARLADAVVLPAGHAVPASGRLGLTVAADCFASDAAARTFADGLAGRADPVLLTAHDDVLMAHSVEQNVAVFRTLHAVSFE